MVLFTLLFFCHRCCRPQRRHSSEDLEKTNTTYIEESQPAQDVSCVSVSSCHGDTDADNFLSVAGAARRVSFNENAIYEPSAKDKERGRSCGSALPGDSLNTSEHSSSPLNPSQTLEMLNTNTPTDGDLVLTAAAGGGPALTQGSVFYFLSKLRRHASLEGAGPFYSVKKWSFDSVQRAASLDTRGSPRRRAFQRQRAASETSEEEHLQSGVCDFLSRNHPVRPKKDHPRRLSAGSLEPDAEPELSRLEAERTMQLRCGTETDPSSALEVKSAEENGHTSEEFGAVSRQESLEQPSLYRDIWSLRASLEHYASSDLSSNDTRSDADSVCSVGPVRAGVSSFRSQDIDDDMDGDGELPYDEGPQRNGRDSVDAEAGNRKLLQMDSGYASIEAPCKPPDDFRLFGGASGKTASERRRFFTSAGRKATVCESFDTRVFKEELEDEVIREAESSLGGAAVKPRAAFCRRDYSIDEKTEALFNEFLRHDPQLDQQGSPSLRHRHRSRVHLRKQWQRSKQYSDPGAARYSPSLERQRCYPLRRGDSANYPLDTRYHSTLPRIASAADEEASEGAGATQSSGPSTQNEGSALDQEENANNSSHNMSRSFSSDRLQDCGIQERSADTQKHSETELATSDPHHIITNPSDKLMSDLDDRLYSGMRTCMSQERTVSVSRTSPDLEEE
ncbi:Voltage-dependent calcium channel beta subunit-associated regulatory protein [Triplophysa tibetana]|uniref:Voltage-dependent calcium channel beta subunit-associated regulatory protein n=1 Tax=Triplophysa tibetana TaxID=1572043 RepID=A0A5A9PAV1_9TELE|nr:Voltage-dependent calcium channel beta subunit-associated regulatory protein [Triplophysa tibetana]